MTGVAGAGKHGIIAADFPGKEDAVAVVGQESVLHLVEGLEIKGIAHADGGAVVAVAPGDVVPVLDEADPGVVAVFPLENLRVGADELDGGFIDLPVEAVIAEAGIEVHAEAPAVAAEHAGVAVAEGDGGGVEDAVCAGLLVAGDDGIFAVAPDGHVVARGLLLPGHIGEGAADNFCHVVFSLSNYCNLNTSAMGAEPPRRPAGTVTVMPPSPGTKDTSSPLSSMVTLETLPA